MSEKRSCENCGNIACANSIIAIHYDECVKSGYSKHWKPKENECTLPPEARKKDCGGCEGCGWERAEAARRRAHLKENGLTLCADGLRRLVIRKERSEMKYTVCDHCGAHLDNGERCDCVNAEGHTRSAVPLETVVDIEKQTEANNRALKKIADFMAE